jgi:23S rRNA pseudouridine955/2504/2580 synthase
MRPAPRRDAPVEVEISDDPRFRGEPSPRHVEADDVSDAFDDDGGDDDGGDDGDDAPDHGGADGDTDSEGEGTDGALPAIEGERTQVKTVKVDSERGGQRLDNYLFTALKGVPKTHVYRILRTGQVRVNGKRAKPDQRIAGGDLVRLPPVRTSAPEDPAFASERSLAEIARAVIFEDKRYLAIDKPSGLATHGGSGIRLGAIEIIRQLRPTESLELVHRLDRDTSGVLLLARKRSALTQAQAAMREGRVRKRYLALLVGKLKKEKTIVDAPLRKDTLRGGERMVEVAEDGKPSLSEFRVLQRFRQATLVEVFIETGRTHQIRVHAQHIGHPVAGDPKYGDAEANLTLRGSGLHRMFLHAAELSFEMGEHGSYTFNAPLPAELSDVIDRLPAA